MNRYTVKLVNYKGSLATEVTFNESLEAAQKEALARYPGFWLI